MNSPDRLGLGEECGICDIRNEAESNLGLFPHPIGIDRALYLRLNKMLSLPLLRPESSTSNLGAGGTCECAPQPRSGGQLCPDTHDCRG